MANQNEVSNKQQML